MVNLNEDKVRIKYERLGYKVLRNGAPDFLMFKYNKEEDKMSDIIFVEVKTKQDKLSYEQSVYRKVLESLGLNYNLEVV